MSILDLASTNDIGTVAVFVAVAVIVTIAVCLASARILLKRSWIIKFIIGSLFVPITLIFLSIALIVSAERNASLSELSSFISPLFFWSGLLILPLTSIVSYFCLRSSQAT